MFVQPKLVPNLSGYHALRKRLGPVPGVQSLHCFVERLEPDHEVLFERLPQFTIKAFQELIEPPEVMDASPLFRALIGQAILERAIEFSFLEAPPSLLSGPSALPKVVISPHRRFVNFPLLDSESLLRAFPPRARDFWESCKHNPLVITAHDCMPLLPAGAKFHSLTHLKPDEAPAIENIELREPGAAFLRCFGSSFMRTKFAVRPPAFGFSPYTWWENRRTFTGVLLCEPVELAVWACALGGRETNRLAINPLQWRAWQTLLRFCSDRNVELLDNFVAEEIFD